MTSETEKLRRLLDENDEYYKTSGNKTWWGRPIDRQTGKPINVFHYRAQPMGEDRLFVELQLATPEQAIAATLGTGTCRMELPDLRGPAFTDVYVCSECGGEVMVGTVMGESDVPKWCPWCGRKVVDA